jgi:hypothetical protein
MVETETETETETEKGTTHTLMIPENANAKFYTATRVGIGSVW